MGFDRPADREGQIADFHPKKSTARVSKRSSYGAAAQPLARGTVPVSQQRGYTAMVKILNVVGARPNFMKMAPIIAAINRRPSEVTQTLVHTGQHYDEAMSSVFFGDLRMPEPDITLETRSGTPTRQMARIMPLFEEVLISQQPDWVVVVGDVNSTIACALVASKLNVRVAHVEAGLRSFDRTMPEEINRLLTDQLADLCGQNRSEEH